MVAERIEKLGAVRNTSAYACCCIGIVVCRAAVAPKSLSDIVYFAEVLFALCAVGSIRRDVARAVDCVYKVAVDEKCVKLCALVLSSLYKRVYHMNELCSRAGLIPSAGKVGVGNNAETVKNVRAVKLCSRSGILYGNLESTVLCAVNYRGSGNGYLGGFLVLADVKRRAVKLCACGGHTGNGDCIIRER